MNFDLFCDECAHIEDKSILQAIPFKRYDCQKSVSDMLVDGKWLILLKARQLGVTWLSATYCLWRLLSKPMFEACVIQQNRDYAKDFLRRVRFVYATLPKWMKVRMTSDSRYELIFGHGAGRESRLRVIAGGDAAGRSLTANLIVFDEHAYVPNAKASREGCEPTMEMSKGQIVLISTSAGPFGDFYDTWQASPQNGYASVFLSWNEHPQRDEDWHKAEALRHASNPMFMAREYPKNATEAFLFAEGRCYPSFHEDRHVRTLDELGFDLLDATLYRTVDFGHVAPFACLWIAHFPESRPSFTVDPSCVNTIREHTAYHFDERYAAKEKPVKLDDHTCFVAGTMVETLEGPRAIETLGAGRFIRSHRGWSLITVGATDTGNGKVVRLTLKDGRTVVCTPDHPFALAGGGWVRADEALGCNVMVWIGEHGVRTKALAERRGSRTELVDDKPRRRLPPGMSWIEIVSPVERRKLPPIGFEAQKVAGINRVDGGLKVYSLATEDGTYLANGILVSNCDALRYAVSQFRLEGHVHVYRELFVRNSVAKGRTDLHDIRDIHEMSGWIEAPDWDGRSYKPGPDAEYFEDTVTDANLPKNTELYCAKDLVCSAYGRSKETSREGDVIDGIQKVNQLIDATEDIRKKVVLTPEQERERLVRRRLRGNRNPHEASASLEEAALREVAHHGVMVADKQRRARSVMRRYRPYGVGAPTR